MAIGDFYKVAILGRSGAGDQLVNTLAYKQASANLYPTPSEDLAQAFAQSDVLGTLYVAAMSDDCKIYAVQVRGITTPSEGFDLALDPELTGTRTGEQLPPQDTCVVTFTTGKIGRRYRGRNFMFPTGEADQSVGAWLTGYTDAVSAYCAGLQSVEVASVTGNYGQHVYSRKFSIGTPVTGHIVRTFVKSQRRRQIGVGS